MRARALLLRILRASAISLLALILLAFAFVQFNQYLLRYRAKHLLADFHSLRLKQSTWPDAQSLMFRWGAFGHYDGSCSAQECVYSIALNDMGSRINSRLYKYMEARWPQRYSGLTLGRAFRVFGGRGAGMQMAFLVEDGRVERSRVGMTLAVESDHFWCDWNCGYGLLLSARAAQSLSRHTGDGPWVMGDEEQLIQHPNYKAGRPDGCEICMSAEVTFTPYASQAETATLTSYNLSCLTRHFHPCRTLPDVLPIARNWRLYPEAEGVPELPEPTGPPKPCDIPVSALGRDASDVLVVKVLSVKTENEPNPMYPSGRDLETARVQILTKLKGGTTWPLNATIDATPYAWDVNYPWQAGEHLEAGRTFIVTPDSEHSKGTLVSMERCGVLPDSPEIRVEMQKGFAQNDDLRYKKKFGSIL